MDGICPHRSSFAKAGFAGRPGAPRTDKACGSGWFGGIAFLLLALCTAVARPEDSIFSAIQFGAVVSPAEDESNSRRGSSSSNVSPPAISPQSAADRLTQLLLQNGYQPRKLNDESVSMAHTIGARTIAVTVATNAAETRLHLTMALTTLAEKRPVPEGLFARLLAANREYCPVSFAYDEQRRSIELHHAAAVNGLTEDRLKSELELLTSIALKTKATWDIDELPARTQQAAATSSAAGLGVASPTLATLAGKWSCPINEQEAFALLLMADGRFTLVHVKQGQQSRSTGNAELNHARLTFAGDDGTRLSGEIAVRSTNAFEFRPQNASGSSKSLAFARAQ